MSTMKHFRSSRFLRLVVLPLTLLAFIPACQGWVGVKTAPGVGEALPNPARLTLKDGRQLELEGATIVADTILGWRRGEPRVPADTDLQRVRVALDDVQKIEHRGTDAGATAVLIGSILVVGTLASVVFFEGLFSQAFADQ